MAKDAPKAVPDSCAGCRHFTAPRVPPEGLDTSRDVAGVYSKGQCRRFPAFVPHAPDDLCGEFHRKG